MSMARLWRTQGGHAMAVTASTDRYPAENVSETAAPHPEEMKAILDLAIGNCRVGQGRRPHHTGELNSQAAGTSPGSYLHDQF
jgi:hypothetical protein